MGEQNFGLEHSNEVMERMNKEFKKTEEKDIITNAFNNCLIVNDNIRM